MRLRNPKDKIDPQFNLEQTLQDLDQQAAQRKEEKWHKYEIEVITPIFGGGVEAGEPDTKMPIRASAIRGQLRYWWRFLAKAENPTWSDKTLFEKEREIWGGMAEAGEDHASKVRIRIENVPNVFPKEFPEKCPEQYQDLRRYPGLAYALFPAREQRHTNPPQPAKKLIWVDSHNKLTFELLLCVPEENFLEVEQALRWWVTFGGIGARTRRGCGSIYCAELFNDKKIKEDIENTGCQLVYPENPEKYTPSDAVTAWNAAVAILYKFRQGSSIGRKPGYGRSYWPEADSLRETIGTYAIKYQSGKLKTHEPEHKARISFPRAAFGLPIEFKFHPKDTRSRDKKENDPETTHLVPFDPKYKVERLASPLILTAYPIRKNGTTRYVPAALLMGNREHIKKMTLALKKGNDCISPQPDNQTEEKKQEWKNRKWDNWQTDWWDESKATLFDPIKKHGGTDALTAFMNFFAEGGA